MKSTSFVQHLWSRRLGIGSLLLALSSCVPPVEVRTSQDPSADFGAYRTFAMLLPNKPVPSDNTDFDPFVLQRLRQLTYLRLKEMGYEPTDKSKADLLVGVLAVQDSRLLMHSSGYYGGTTYGGPLYGPTYSTDYVTEVEEGIVVVDMISREKKSVIWRGKGVRSLSGGPTDAQLKELVDTILASYPTATVQAALGSPEPSSTPEPAEPLGPIEPAGPVEPAGPTEPAGPGEK